VSVPEPASPAALLPFAAPSSPSRRLLLFMVRRMAAGGLGDAYAAHATFTAFGLAFRRPLLLVRALMAELSGTSRRRLSVAPCCCPRMTPDEAMLVHLVGAGPMIEEECTRLLGGADGSGFAAAAVAVAAAFADCALPLADDWDVAACG
jgi:hypothetical protein